MRFTEIIIALVLVGPLVLSGTEPGWAHFGAPSLAPLHGPVGVGEVADESYTVSWDDADITVPTGPATVDIYYTAVRPATFAFGVLPDPLEGQVIVEGVAEEDLDNTFEWDTREVPDGTYWLWTRVNEPPSEMLTRTFITYSPGVLTVAHSVDRVHPAVMITRPDTSAAVAADEYEIRYRAFDPDGTGVVRLEAFPPDSDSALVLADDLPATMDGRFLWDTSELAEGDWTLRIQIRDDRGLSFQTFGHHFLAIARVTKMEVRDSDMGFSDVGNEADVSIDSRDDGAGTPMSTDAAWLWADRSVPQTQQDGGGCAQSAGRNQGGWSAWLLFSLFFAASCFMPRMRNQ